jgi:hypothetical protein
LLYPSNGFDAALNSEKGSDFVKIKLGRCRIRIPALFTVEPAKESGYG